MTDITSTSCDWITLTKIWDDAEVQENYPKGFYSLLRYTYQNVSVVSQDWGSLGYKGEQCTETKIRYGRRLRDGGILDEILVGSGKASDMIVDDIPATSDVKCTRFDMQTTVYMDKPKADVAATLYAVLVASKVAGASITGRRKCSLVQSDTGQTLYVGKRNSGRKFFRLYDKSADLQAPIGSVWRQEVQYGRNYSHNAWEWYKSNRDNQDAQEKMVSGEFKDAMNFTLTNAGMETELIPASETEQGTIKSKLAWLTKCVRPVVAFLVASGYEKEVVATLGLAGALPRSPKPPTAPSRSET